MGADLVQAEYEILDTVGKRFGACSTGVLLLHQRVERQSQALVRYGWQGQGAQRFATELDGVVLPALQRLGEALVQADTVSRQIKAILVAAEQEAAALFVGQGGGATPWVGLLAGEGIQSEGGRRGFLAWAQQQGFPWAAPFAAGAVVFGPGPIPIFGPWGRVPAGYTNAGSRLWLYIGGAETDTIFSIHPHAGWGRAPFRLPKPNLRFDYGTLRGQAFLPDGTKILVPHGPNFFHWNHAGGMGLSRRGIPLWRTFGGMVTHDHQLLNHTVPPGNAWGTIGGARVVRGVSRGLFVAGAGLDAYSIATADNKVRESVRVAGGWGGAWAGAKGGMIAGAWVGSFFGPGPGTAIGAGVGGFIGGVGGYIFGSNAGEAVYDGATD